MATNGHQPIYKLQAATLLCAPAHALRRRFATAQRAIHNLSPNLSPPLPLDHPTPMPPVTLKWKPRLHHRGCPPDTQPHASCGVMQRPCAGDNVRLTPLREEQHSAQTLVLVSASPPP
eukprot:scaffold17028_cov159-Isochrysis_galbana.AAC.1